MYGAKRLELCSTDDISIYVIDEIDCQVLMQSIDYMRPDLVYSCCIDK